MGNHQALLQVAAALRDRTADVRLGHSHLGRVTTIIPFLKCQMDWSTLKSFSEKTENMKLTL